MAFTLSQDEIDELAKSGAIRDEAGLRLHRMSSFNRHKEPETATSIDPLPHGITAADVERACEIVALAIRDAQSNGEDARLLIQDILKSTLKSNEEALLALKDALHKKQTPKKWTFDIERDTAGRMIKIHAEEN